MNIHQSLENFYLGMRDQIALGHADAYIWIGLSDTVTPGNFSWINGTGLTNTPYFVHISTRHFSNGSRYGASGFNKISSKISLESNNMGFVFAVLKYYLNLVT